MCVKEDQAWEKISTELISKKIKRDFRPKIKECQKRGLFSWLMEEDTQGGTKRKSQDVKNGCL